MKSAFNSYGINRKIVDRLQGLGINIPTNVQELSIPQILFNRDLCIQAPTGSGKTLAFLLPLLHLLQTSLGEGLIIVPTRELVIQIAEVARSLVDDLKILAIYGGQSLDKEMANLSNNHTDLIVGTPGRLNDHLRRGTLTFQTTKYLVIDEADLLFKLGFKEDVESIVQNVSSERQTVLISATLAHHLMDWQTFFRQEPIDIRINYKKSDVSHIKQLAITTSDREKFETLCRIIHQFQPFKSIIFCRTIRRVKNLHKKLQDKGYHVLALHGDLSQNQREQVVSRFKDELIPILVATDLASRGLDVDFVTHIVNYDFPRDVETYVHRIGRTGRAGQYGLAITCVTPKEEKLLKDIEHTLNIHLSLKRLVDK
ncbi:DEAD/DEAH box helicase [Terrilactibacillus laevilacticus]|uniref:DEAD/DEAH box helicase n=1 Tax=Terrilactibacillus laevilacticus TaxID=1380157 RepID=UPI0011469D1F|nr:DEAD/DEAH box helicase [Terrilactibacillus laevilacticus]